MLVDEIFSFAVKQQYLNENKYTHSNDFIKNVRKNAVFPKVSTSYIWPIRCVTGAKLFTIRNQIQPVQNLTLRTKR